MCVSVKTGRDPSLNVVLLEDTASLFGVCIALGAVTLSGYLQSPIPDSIGSIAIGCLLAGVATFIIRQNTVLYLRISIQFIHLGTSCRSIDTTA